MKLPEDRMKKCTGGLSGPGHGGWGDLCDCEASLRSRVDRDGADLLVELESCRLGGSTKVNWGILEWVKRFATHNAHEARELLTVTREKEVSP